jgi:hypothetical protein
MTNLEQIKRGAQVNGILPNQSVNIIDDKWHGPNILEVTYKTESGELGTELLMREDESGYGVQTRQSLWRFDADSALLRLVTVSGGH